MIPHNAKESAAFVVADSIQTFQMVKFAVMF